MSKRKKATRKKSSIRRKKQIVVVLSGGTGRTGQQLVKSALAQFADPLVELVLRPEVRTVRAGQEAVQWAKKNNAIICHTLVQRKVREAVVREALLHAVPTADLLGPTLALLNDRLDSVPQNHPGLSHEKNREQFERMDSVDFTMAHDDGVRTHELRHADIVLVGPSRVSKSVTCFYLACRGVRAANVPLIPSVELPDGLLEVEPQRVVALTMNPHRLQNLRDVRGGTLGVAKLTSYSDLREIVKEVRYVLALSKKYGWRNIDVSYTAVEEVAAEALKLVGLRTT